MEEHTIRMAIKYLIGSAHYTLFVAALLIVIFNVGWILFRTYRAARRMRREQQARHRR